MLIKSWKPTLIFAPNFVPSRQNFNEGYVFLIPLAIRLRIQTVKYIYVGPFPLFLCIAVCNFFFLLHKTNNRMLALVQFSFVCILETE